VRERLAGFVLTHIYIIYRGSSAEALAKADYFCLNENQYKALACLKIACQYSLLNWFLGVLTKLFRKSLIMVFKFSASFNACVLVFESIFILMLVGCI